MVEPVAEKVLMARPRATEIYSSEANIWPAVTDSILLMASIFIVLSVIALASIARRLDDQAGAGQEPGDKVICEVVGLSADLLFPEGESYFLDGQAAGKTLRDELWKLVPKLPALKRYAEGQKDWGGKYYLVLEVSGHTNTNPMRGYPPGVDGNWRLATERAVKVGNQIESIMLSDGKLREAFNLKPGNKTAQPHETVLRLAGYSSHLPSVPYESNKDLAMKWNRRVELRVYAQPIYLLRTELKP